MQNDTYGEAKSFFELSDRRLHEIVRLPHRIYNAGVSGSA
jgi:hypothetical protein